MVSALFQDSPMDSKSSNASRSLFQTAVKANGLNLEEAAKRGDMERVSQIAVELLRVARQGDVDGVLALISSKQELQGSAKTTLDIKFSPNISVVHELQNGISVEQVSFVKPRFWRSHVIVVPSSGADRFERKCRGKCGP